jgi:hypothetical protein
MWELIIKQSLNTIIINVCHYKKLFLTQIIRGEDRKEQNAILWTFIYIVSDIYLNLNKYE